MLVVSLNALVAADEGPPPDPKELARQLAEEIGVANGRDAVLDVDYLVKGLLVRGEVSVIYGPPNCGKSTLVTTIGMSVVRGVDFAGLRTRRAGALHIAPEGAFAIHGTTVPYIGNGTAPDAEPYIVHPLRIDLRERLHGATLVELVRLLRHQLDCDIGLIVIDTFVLSIGDADENSSRDVTAAMANAARIAQLTNAHVACIHHSNKLGELRGSSAILGACDTSLEVSLSKERAGVVRLKQIKQKTTEKGRDILFRVRSHVLGLDSDGDPRTTAVIEILPLTEGSPAPEAAQPPGNDKRRDGVLAALRALSLDPAAATVGFEPSTIRDACDRAAFAGCEKSGSFLRAVTRALEALAGEPTPVIVKAGGRYRLVEPALSLAVCEPRLSDPGIAAE